MGIDLVFPNAVQTQRIADRPVNLEALATTLNAKLAPVVTRQTVTSVKAALPASPLADRNQMIIKNLDPIRTIRIGTEGTVTAKIGRVVEPMEELTILFDPESAVAIWAIAVGAEVRVEVIES